MSVASLAFGLCTGPAGGMPSVGNAIHAISIHDVASDTVHQFAPTYRDYVLYSDSNNPEEVKEPPKTFRAKTFVAIGAVRRRPPYKQRLLELRLCWYMRRLLRRRQGHVCNI